MMAERELKEAIIQYIKECYERSKKPPSLRKISEHFRELNFARFYKIFLGGIREACALADVPIPMERIKRTEKATKALRMRERGFGEVEDEGIKEVLARALEWERKRDKAKALLEAERREKAAKMEALKSEAKLDPKKIPKYLEETKSPLLGDLRHACALERTSLEEGCLRAVDWYGETFLESGDTFEEYIKNCLTVWTELVKLEHAQKRYSRETYDCRCSVCGAKYEYAIDDDVPILHTFTCANNCEGSAMFYPCTVCQEAYDIQETLIYDPERNVLRCSFCGSEFKVTPPAMRPSAHNY